jgi:hypothetical protein
MKRTKNNVEIIKSYEEYKLKSNVRVLEERINKMYKFGFTFWIIIAIVLLFFVLIKIL